MTPDKSILGRAPFFRYCIALIIGIAISNLFRSFPVYLTVGLIISLALFSLFVWKTDIKQHQNRVVGVVMTILFLGIGIASKTIYNNQLFSSYMPVEGIYSGTIMEKSPSTKGRCKYEVKLSEVVDIDKVTALKETILLFISDSTLNNRLIPGTQITFESKLFEITSLNNPGEFNYQQYLKNRGIRYQCYLRNGLLTDSHLKANIKTYALNVRSSLLEAFHRFGIKGDEFAVLAALTLGEKDFLTSGLKKSYAVSGAMHVLSVSGLHVGIIYMFLAYLLKPLKRNRKMRIISFSILFSFLWIYAFITGLSPSVLRSCAMFSFVLVGDNIGRKTNIYNTLASSAFFLLMINPGFLYDIGFQLSYLALLSIVYFQPKIKGLYQPKNKHIEKLWDLLAVAVAAQIGTFPLSVFYFHQFPVYFFLSNYVVIPLSGFLLYGTFLFYFVTWIPFVAKFFGFILSGCTRLLNFCIKFIEELPGSLISDLWISETSLIILIIAILVIVLYMENRKKMHFYITLIPIFLLMLNFSFEQIKTNRQNVAVFYNSYNEPLMSIIVGKNHYYYSPSDTLSHFSEQLLSNSTGVFKTKKALNISSLNEYPNGINRFKNHLLIKNISIEIDEQELEYDPKSNKSDIIWFQKNNVVKLKNNENIYAFHCIDGKQCPISNQQTSDGIKIKDNGALFLRY